MATTANTAATTAFQFTHPGGVRPPPAAATDRGGRFQFTHPGGVRHPRRGELLIDRRVSIHAPGRGATASRFERRLYGSSFNSRTREGCDAIKRIHRHISLMFQFTHPGGVRHTRPRGFLGDMEFQFTHPGGVRLTRLSSRRSYS